MIPNNSATAMSTHVNAIGMLLRGYGPEAFGSGVLHRLFVGFRPLLVRGLS